MHRSHIFLFCLCFALSLAAGPRLAAKTYHSTSVDYQLDAPSTWVGSFSSNRASLRLVARRSSDLMITIQAKRVRDNLKGNAVLRQFKGQYAAKKRAEPKVIVSIKPERTTIGEFPGYHYAFRYRNFIDQVFDERTIWFNAKRPTKNTLLLFKILIKGPAKAYMAEQRSIATILASFCMVGKKKQERPADPTPQPTRNVTQVQVSTPKPTKTADTGFDGGRSRGGYSGDDDDDDYEPAPDNFKFSNKRGTDYSALYGKVEAKNVAGLMHNAKRIDDPEKLRKAKRTFLHRNRRRTADQKRRAAKYMAGFGNDDVRE